MDSLNNLWIFVEQLISFLWKRTFVDRATNHPKDMEDRIKSLKQIIEHGQWRSSLSYYGKQKICLKNVIVNSPKPERRGTDWRTKALYLTTMLSNHFGTEFSNCLKVPQT